MPSRVSFYIKSFYRWKIQEACLLAIGRASEELIDSIQDKESGVQFDLAGLFDHVVLEHMKSTGASHLFSFIIGLFTRVTICVLPSVTLLYRHCH